MRRRVQRYEVWYRQVEGGPETQWIDRHGATEWLRTHATIHAHTLRKKGKKFDAWTRVATARQRETAPLYS